MLMAGHAVLVQHHSAHNRVHASGGRAVKWLQGDTCSSGPDLA